MDFLSLSKEYDTYKEHIENSSYSMNYFLDFFQTFQKNLNDYATNIHKSLNNTVTNLIKFDNKSTYIKKFFTVMRLLETHLLKLISISKKIFSEIVKPTSDFSKYIINDNNNKLNELRKIINETSFAKKKYENTKKEYLLSCRKITEQEKVLLKEMDNKNNNNEINIKNQNDLLTQLRIDSQLMCVKYKEDYKALNEIYDLNNKKYFPIINDLRDNEEKRINFIFFNLEKFISYLTEKNNSLNEFITNLKQEDTNKNFMKVKLEQDMKNYKQKFNFCKKDNTRFIKEDLFLYEIHKKNLDLIIKNPNYLNSANNSNLNNINNINNININNNLLPYISYNHNVFNFETVKVKLNYDDQIIFNNLFDGTLDNPNLDNKKFSSFKKRLIDDIKFSEEIIDKMLGEVFQRPIYYEFNNYEKFESVKQILVDISMNKEVRTNIMEMNYGIIFIAEKGFYFDKNLKEKKYLSKEIIKEDNNFKSKYFWKKLLENKINSNLKKLNKTLEEENNKKSNPNKIKEKKEITIKKEIMNIIKDYIVHFTNFNLAISDINDILLDIKTNYSLSDNEISYLICFLNSNTYNIRSKYHKDEKNSLFTKKIKNTKNQKYKKILLTLNSCFMFLRPQDFINIKNLNKAYYSQIEKLIFKQIFIKRNKGFLNSRIDLSNKEKHFEMWFYYLKYDKNKINYKTKSDEVKQSKNLEDILEIIQLDVNRTHFEKDKENKRKIIKNVLISLAYTYPEVSYCQGMNYISLFLLEITKDEEKSFDIFSALLNKTEYSKLSINDFDLMKKYFYVFERLICIYLPELYTTFKRNNINTNYFISPWFITLYTHGYNGKNTKILIRIFDLFILDGWLAIIRIGLVLLKYYQDDLINMEFEELLHFLINELKEKYDFFNDNNYEKFIELYNEIKLPKGLVNNLENEFELNKKIIYK